MSKCKANSPQDHYECEKYYSWHSSHYDSYYNTKVVEFTCSHCGHHVYADESGKKLLGLK